METETFAFGAFRLTPTQRTQLDGGGPHCLGSRALDILGPPVENAGETVRKELMGVRGRTRAFHGFFLGELSGLLRWLGRIDEGLIEIDAALDYAEKSESLWCMP